MIQNANVGDYIFFRRYDKSLSGNILNTKWFYAIVVENEPHDDHGYIEKRNLNGLARSVDHEIPVENEFAHHEIIYMRSNSQRH